MNGGLFNIHKDDGRTPVRASRHPSLGLAAAPLPPAAAACVCHCASKHCCWRVLLCLQTTAAGVCRCASIYCCWRHLLLQEETIRELTAALEAKEVELEASRQQAAAQAEDALVARMQVGGWAVLVCVGKGRGRGA